MRILVVNPGSTSTKISVFENEEEIWDLKLSHSQKDLSPFGTNIFEQYGFRRDVIVSALKEAGYPVESFHGIVGRGGLVKPIPGGTYLVDDHLLKDLETGILGQHASNLGGPIAAELAKTAGCDAFIVDPVVVDEMEPVAKFSGNPLIARKSIFHALNQKAVARKAADELGVKYAESNFVVVHLGGGISVGAHKKGLVVDVNNALDGDGPFTPERSGGVPAGDLVKLCFSGDYSLDEIKKMIKGHGGIVAYLGTNDMMKVEDKVMAGNAEWLAVYRAMAYQIGKETGAMAAVLKGRVDAVVISGGIAYDKQFISWLREMVEFIAPVVVYPGEMEMEALALGALRVLRSQETPRSYNPE